MKERNIYRGTTLISGPDMPKPQAAQPVPQVFKLDPVCICPACGTAGAAHTMPGTTLMEVALWVVFLPGGAVYSVWRRAKRSHGCAVCGAKTLPISTPKGQQLARTHYPDGVPAVQVPTPKPVSKLVVFGVLAIMSVVIFTMAGGMR